MAREYRVLFGYIIVFVATVYMGSSLIIWLPVFISVTSLYSLYRRSTVFLKFRSKKSRYFIRSDFDQPYTKKDLYIGISLILCGVIYFVSGPYFNLNALVGAAIISSFVALGCTRVLAFLFFEALPVTELMIKEHSIEIFRSGSLVKELYSLTDFEVSDNSVSLISQSKKYELPDLYLTAEEQAQLIDDLNLFAKNTNLTIKIQKSLVKNWKKHLKF